MNDEHYTDDELRPFAEALATAKPKAQNIIAELIRARQLIEALNFHAASIDLPRSIRQALDTYNQYKGAPGVRPRTALRITLAERATRSTKNMSAIL